MNNFTANITLYGRAWLLATKPRSSKQGSVPVSPPLKTNRSERGQHRTPSDPRSVSSPRTPRQPRRGPESVQGTKSPGGRGSSQGATVKVKDGHASHWAFLFQSLRIVVDEIYRICEDDESVVECKVIIVFFILSLIIIVLTDDSLGK